MAAQFLGKIIEALQTTMTALGTKADSQVAALGSMETKLDTEITKLQSIIDGQYSGDLYCYASETQQYINADVLVTPVSTDAKLWEYTVLVTGQIKLALEAKSSYSGTDSNMYAAVQKNGVEEAKLGQNGIKSDMYRSYDVLVSVEKGDVLSVWGYTNTTFTTTVKNIELLFDINSNANGFDMEV